MRKALKWSLAPMALVAMAIAPAMAQDATSGSAVAYSYAGDAKDAAPATPAAPMDTAACGCNTCGCDSCGNGCCDGCCCPKIDWCWLDQVKVGVGLRTSWNDVVGENGTLVTPTSGHYQFFAQNDARIYISGKGNDYIKFTLNTEVFGIDNDDFPTFNVNELPPGQQSMVRLLDGIVQFEMSDTFNVWMGRFLPPSDRANLCGPFYQTPYDYPFVSNYPQVFAGRDDGAAYWGQVGGGAFKWQVGVFNGTGRGFQAPAPADVPNQTGDLMFAARVTLNLLDPEPGYYAQSSYFGDKDILALGAAIQSQTDAVGTVAAPRNFTGYSFDTMYETRLANCGVITFNGAYYNFSDQDAPIATTVAAQGTADLLEASYLTAQEFCFGKVSGHIQPFVRYQYYNYADKAGAAGFGLEKDQFDVGSNYVISGYNARLTAVWESQVFQSGAKDDVYRVGAQLQF
jgi:hypothetical protein